MSRPLRSSPLRKTHGLAAGHDDVVEDFDVDQRKRLFDAVSDVFVGLRGLGHSEGVDVGQDDFGGVVFEGFLAFRRSEQPWRLNVR